MAKELAERAAEFGARFFMLELTLDEKAVKERLQKRLEGKTVSDGRWEIYLEQKPEFEPVVEAGTNHVIIDGSEPTLSNVRKIIDSFNRA